MENPRSIRELLATLGLSLGLAGAAACETDSETPQDAGNTDVVLDGNRDAGMDPQSSENVFGDARDAGMEPQVDGNTDGPMPYDATETGNTDVPLEGSDGGVDSGDAPADTGTDDASPETSEEMG